LDKHILIFTGNGKGKSTAAFGMALRARGHDHRVLVIQFIKNDTAVGELASLQKLGISIVQTGRGFIPKPGMPRYTEHQEAAQEGFVLACKSLQSSDYDLIILDEICGAVAKGLLDEQEVIDAIVAAPAPLNIVLTGRGATDKMIAMADTVSEIQPLKHALDQGVQAREGVEF